MRVVVASADVESTSWLEPILRSGGFSVVVVADASPTSPELKTADVVIVDRFTADALADAVTARRVLLVRRGGTLDLDAVRRGFSDILVVPSDETEVVERVRYAAG